MPPAELTGIRQIEELVLRMENIPDPSSREVAKLLMEAVLKLHGEGFARILELVAAAENGSALVRRLAGDNLVSALLLLHDLHPDDLETRVRHALRKWHGMAELASVFDGVVRVRLKGASGAVREAVQLAVGEAAPDAIKIVFEDGAPPSVFVPLSALGTTCLPEAE